MIQTRHGYGESAVSLISGFTLLVVIAFIIQKSRKEYAKYVALKMLPGPSPSSLLAGNLDKFFDAKESVEWHQHLTEKYGSAVRLTGPFGVSSC